METFELKVADSSGPVAVLEVAGYINNEGGEAIARESARLLEAGAGTLLFDLRATRIINSIGISLLLEVLEKTIDARAILAFCCLSPSIAKTFQIMGLAQYARIYPDREQALIDLRPQP